MGKGGEKSVSKGVQVKKGSWKLKDVETEVLRKWAKAYNVDKKFDERDALLEQLEPYADGILDPLRPANLPLEIPKFTLKDIKDAIPKHCFERNMLTSFTHLFSDLAIVAVFGYLATYINTPLLPSWSAYILWPIYWFAQGAVLTGVWVISHECGHQAFSDYEWVNNTVGTIFHSLLLVPYHSWRITHGLHHNNTGSCENDEVFCPSKKSDFVHDMIKETPIMYAFMIVRMLTVGWMPGYLIFNATGPAKYRGQDANHFSPSAVFFKPEEYWLIVQTDIAFFLALGLLAYSIYTFGFINVLNYYLLPYMIVNYHLVLITYLQHTDVFMPHFRGTEWNWLRGALCTVDRSFGAVLDHTFHHITDTHVCHHVFSKMPFYHAQEATQHIKRVLGPYYMKDDTPIAHALWRSFTCCRYIEDEGNIVFYKNE
jgi:omega-6 fatty acid desaturase (delta-12 desaturase)